MTVVEFGQPETSVAHSLEHSIKSYGSPKWTRPRRSGAFVSEARQTIAFLFLVSSKKICGDEVNPGHLKSRKT